MRTSKIFRWALYILGGLIAGILLIAIVLAFVPITVDLSEYKGAVESAASLALGRSVKVDDKIIIATSLQPFFSLEGLRIGNPANFQAGDFLYCFAMPGCDQFRADGITTPALPYNRLV